MHHQEIRGYFFDPDKNKYFKLAPHSSAIGHPYRRDTVLAKQQAVPAASSAATRPKTVLRSFAAALRQRETWATAQGGENAYERLVGGFGRVSHFAHSSPILTRPAEVVRAMCVSADERWLAMALQLQTQVVKVHDMEGGDEDSVAFEGWGVSDLCWSPLAGDATLGATISGGESPVSLLMLQRLTGETGGVASFQVPSPSLYSLSWGRASPALIGLGGHKGGLLFDIGKAKVAGRMHTNQSDVFAVRHANSAKVIVAGSRDGHVRWFDTRQDGRLSSQQDHATGISVTSIALLDDAARVVAAGGFNNALNIVDLRVPHKPLLSLNDHRSEFSRLVVSTDASYHCVFAAGSDQHVRVWSARSGGEPLHTWPIETAQHIAWCNDGLLVGTAYNVERYSLP